MPIVKELADVLFGIALFINGILFIPQVIKLYRKKDSQELSLLTFGGFNIIQLATAVHGYFYQDMILMVGALFSLLTCALITILIIVYRFA